MKTIGWMNTYPSLCCYNFEIHYINGEVNHSKCHFSHYGSCSRIHYLLLADSMLREQLANKMPTVFRPVKYLRIFKGSYIYYLYN